MQKIFFQVVSSYDLTFLFTLQKVEFLIVIVIRSSGIFVSAKITDFTIELSFSLNQKISTILVQIVAWLIRK